MKVTEHVERLLRQGKKPKELVELGFPKRVVTRVHRQLRKEKTTVQSYLRGMSRIAPPGMRPKATRGRKFDQRTDFGVSTRWHHNWDMAMFGGTDIESPTSESKQRTLEMEFRRR